MTLDDFKIGLKTQGIIADETLELFGDEQLETFLPMINEYENKDKLKQGFATLGLIIGLKIANYDTDQVLDVLKEARQNPKKYIDGDEADWLLKKIKLGIK